LSDFVAADHVVTRLKHALRSLRIYMKKYFPVPEIFQLVSR
jgi:hypothetical protein